MKAIVWTKYGSPDVLQLKEVARPAPRASEVLVRIYATTVTTGDCELRWFELPPLFRLPLRLRFGLRRPRNIVPGLYLAGEIEAVGKIVRVVNQVDNARDLSWKEAAKDRFEFYLHSLIANDNVADRIST